MTRRNAEHQDVEAVLSSRRTRGGRCESSSGADQERLGTLLSEAWPSAALFASCILLVLFLVLRIALRFAGRELPRHQPLEVE